MTQQFHEGQEVEVLSNAGDGKIVPIWHWLKARIVRLPHAPNALDDGRKYVVQFPDGQRAVFDAAHIRLSKEQVEQELIKNGERFLDAMGDEPAEYPGLAEPDDDTSEPMGRAP